MSILQFYFLTYQLIDYEDYFLFFFEGYHIMNLIDLSIIEVDVYELVLNYNWIYICINPDLLLIFYLEFV